jgi:hypothetical protein
LEEGCFVRSALTTRARGGWRGVFSGVGKSEGSFGIMMIGAEFSSAEVVDVVVDVDDIVCQRKKKFSI